MGEQLNLIEEVVKPVETKVHMHDAQDGVWNFHKDCVWNLEMAGFKNIPYSILHNATTHILFRIKPPYLKTIMKNTILWKNDENFDKQDFDAFMRELAKQANNFKLKRDFVHTEGLTCP